MTYDNVMDVSALEFVVVSLRTGNPIASFLLSSDAIFFADWMEKCEGPNGAKYEVVDRYFVI